MACESCGDKPKKCNKDFTKAVIEIDNPEQITLMRKVTIPASMGDDTTVPPAVGKYHNVLLYYEANQKSYLYSSDGIPTQLTNGITDYEAATNLPQINSHTLIGDKTGDQLGLQDKLTAGDNITIENNVISATDTTYGPATDTEIGLVKPGDGLEVDANGTMSISDIEQYAHFFDTVADMKAATNFVNGSYAKTLGYYTKDDEGGATYKIRTKTIADTADEMTLITLADTALIAELVKTDIMNVKQFGAKGDGTNDDTLAIQTALDNCATIAVPTGTYMVDAITHINPNSNNKLILANDATLKAITNDVDSYAVILINNVSNVEISGGVIQGDRVTHTGIGGEWGMCISVRGTSDNIFIHHITLKEAWGDGIYCEIIGSMQTEEVKVIEARRNGYSIIRVDNFISNNDIIINTNGTPPSFGVDVEPNLDTDVINNVIFNNLTTSGNIAGFGIALSALSTNTTTVRVNNLMSNGDGRGINLTTGENTKGQAIFTDCVIQNSGQQGMLINPGGVKYMMEFIRPIIDGYKGDTASSYGLMIQSSGNRAHGNVKIKEPIIINPRLDEAIVNYAIGSSLSSGWLDNIQIIDPINFDGRRIRGFISGQEGAKCIITDKYKILNRDTNNNSTYNGDQYFLETSTSIATANRNITIADANFFNDLEFNFLNTGDYKLNIIFTNQYIYPLSSSTGRTVTLNDKGSSLKIRRIGTGAWMVISQSGNITTN